MQYDAIPSELKQLAQWVCVGADKVPLNPFTGGAASVTNSETWSTFDVALQRSGGHGIGFVFTDADPYSFIDLDTPINEQQAQKHGEIYNAFNSYTELSRSGKGVHIIVRGKVPHGVRRDKVELYSSARYAIMTGNALKALPIADCQVMLNGMYSQMQPTGTGAELVQVQGLFSDYQITEMASCAANGDKFDRLARGEWKGMGYPSQSEADFALLSIIAFYTPDNEQVRRIFRATALGRRTKATRNDKYLNYTLTKIRGNEPPKVDFSKLKFPESTVHEAAPAELELPLGTLAPSAQSPLFLPPGLTGLIADYIYRSANRPMPEAAIAGAIGLMAGICGRAYNTLSKAGLNQYVILLAPTGSGKEDCARGIDAILTQARPLVPSIKDFMGPAVFSSGQGLLRTLEKRPCFVSVLPEFGITLCQLSSERASSAETMLRRCLLDLYTKSGHGRTINEMAYSDRDKNTTPIISPALTVIGESTPSRFYEGLNLSAIEEGLVPRFMLLEAHGDGPERNRLAGFLPDAALVKAIADLATVCLTMHANNTVQSVAIDDEAQAVLDAFEMECDHNRKSTHRGADKELWSRNNLKVLKLASLIAVGCHSYHPIVTAGIARWAIDVVVRGTKQLVKRFNSGEMGMGEVRFEIELRNAIDRYKQMRPAQRLNAKCPQDCIAYPVVPYAYLFDQLKRRVVFQNARMGMMRAIQTTISSAIETGILTPLAPSQLIGMQIRSKCWAIGEG